MAEFERSLIEERVRAGLRNARAKGKVFGRPRTQVDALRVAELRRDGLSWSQVRRTLNVSKGTAQRPRLDREIRDARLRMFNRGEHISRADRKPSNSQPLQEIQKDHPGN